MRARERNYRLMLAALALPAFIWMVPILWMLSLSFQPNELLQATTTHTAFGLIPARFTVQNYIDLFTLGNAPVWLFNSFVVAMMMVAGVLFVSVTAGYAFARLSFPGKAPIFVLCLLGLMVPEQAIFIPLYTLVADLGWQNTHHGVAIPRIATPIGVFMMAQFFRSIPRDIEEAALVDGIGRFRIFLNLHLPLMLPAVVTLAIITFLYAWNDYLWPLVSLQKTANYTIAVGIASTQTNFAHSEGLGRLMAAGMMASMPVIAFYLLFQKHVVRAIALSAAKG